MNSDCVREPAHQSTVRRQLIETESDHRLQERLFPLRSEPVASSCVEDETSSRVALRVFEGDRRPVAPPVKDRILDSEFVDQTGEVGNVTRNGLFGPSRRVSISSERVRDKPCSPRKASS